jgi:hypothetical protein
VILVLLDQKGLLVPLVPQVIRVHRAATGKTRAKGQLDLQDLLGFKGQLDRRAPKATRVQLDSLGCQVQLEKMASQDLLARRALLATRVAKV